MRWLPSLHRFGVTTFDPVSENDADGWGFALVWFGLVFEVVVARVRR